MAMIDTSVRRELLGASDEEIADAVEHADLMGLRGLLYLLTGDEEVASTELTIVRQKFFEIPFVVDEAAVRLLRGKAVEWLKAYRDSGAGEVTIDESRLATSLRLATALDLEGDDVDFYLEELALEQHARQLHWQAPPPPGRLEAFEVVVIGSGMGGLTAALELKRAGIPFTVFEKNSGVGGTWHENRYPGARVDTPSRGYTNTYGVRFEYPWPFCPWTENQRYFDWVADSFGLRDSITFDTEVRSLTWDDDAGEWEVAISGPDGERTRRARAVITAVGFLNRPNIPEIPGMLDFAGPSWHTARWPDGFDTAGKRFAVVGTGCSGYQMIPELALEAEHVTVFQRTPQWLLGTPGYRSPFPPQVNWLDRNLPFYSNFLRSRSSVIAHSFGILTEVDPDYDEDPHACNPVNKRLRDSCIEFLESKIADPELVKAMTPPHPVWSARPVNCDPDYNVLDAIQRDDVTLVTSGISRITATGIETADGTRHEVDVIVYATGFHATEYLFPMTITGRDGVIIEEVWADGPRAYLGSMVPGFPNLFMVYGPNTNGAFQPSTFHELVVRYALECLERLILDGKSSIEPRREPYHRYNDELDERNARKVWSDPRANNYYWTDKGRSATQNPFLPGEMYRRLRHPDFDELDIR